MDEEDERNSLGAYDNMERSDIRPNFAADALGNSAKNFFRNSEESAKNTAKDVGEKASEKVASKVAEKGLDTATGGVGGKVLKAAEKTGVTKNLAPMGQKADAKAKIKKALPIVFIFAVVMGGFGILGTSTFSLFGAAFSALMKRNDTTNSVNRIVSDHYVDNVQLGGNNSSSEYGDVIFDEATGFSDYQIQTFARAGLQYTESGGTKALVHNNFDGSKTYIVADSAVSGTLYYGDEVVGSSNDEYVDAGASDGKTEAERISDLAIALNVSEGSKVVKFSEALKDFNIKNEYIAATDAYRSGMGAWYSDTANSTTERLGISLNNWKDFENSNDNARNEEIVIQTAAEKSANENNDVKTVSYQELVDAVAEESQRKGCGFDSAATAIDGVANAGETFKQVTAGALIMEAIDKTLAGEGAKAPMNAVLNLVFKAGGTDTESMHNLFGKTKLNQSSNDILSTSAQANLGTNGTVNLDVLASNDAMDEAETCMYVGNVNNYESQGIIPTIGSMFKSIGGWIRNRASDIASFFVNLFRGGAGGVAEVIVEAVNPAVSRFDRMKENVYLSGHDNKLVGEAMVSSAELIANEMSKSVTATMPGDTGAVETAYRIQQETIAERAEYERTTKSPFDITSENTFLGKIAYSLIPFATSNTALSLTSTVSKIGSLLSNATSSLLPTSSAISGTLLQANQGDCAIANSVAAFSNARCHNYQTFNLASIRMLPTAIFNKVASLRIDEGGYKYGINADETGPGTWANKLSVDYDDGAGRAYEAADYGNGPLNPEENSLESHWGVGERVGVGTPHGCESDWQWEDDHDRPIYRGGIIVGYERLYHFDQPSEWSYTRLTNFEYEGYKTGYPNLVSASENGLEGAKNEEDPGICQLDLKTDEQKQPVININSALGMFILMSGQRTSEIGVADQNNADIFATIDFLHGRLHPCAVQGGTLLCEEFTDSDYGWSSDIDEIIENLFLSRLISGSAYVNYTGNTNMMRRGYENDGIFQDETTGTFFTEETKYYSAYISLIEWMEASNLLTRAADSVALERYYENNPLDNSYAGILARYSGYSKDTVIAVLNLVDYAEWLANYDPLELYPLGPKDNITILYDNPEIIAETEPIIKEDSIIYDELRNRTVTV